MKHSPSDSAPSESPSALIRAQRPAKAGEIDPWRPLDVLLEDELGADGNIETWLTLFLAGAECPFTCTFCDLWRHTLDGATPQGAIPAQIRTGLEHPGSELATGIKLYNASNFFESRAVPRIDDEACARLLQRFATVTVECHPRLVGERALAFATRLSGRLEVAMGLEVADDRLLEKLNKQMTRGDFRRAAQRLAHHQIGLRSFVLIGPPFVPPSQRLGSLLRTVDFALDCGSDIVSLIPLRTGNHAADLGLGDVERAFSATRTQANGARVQLDTWDLDDLAACASCGPARIRRLRDARLGAELGPAVDCALCDGSADECR